MGWLRFLVPEILLPTFTWPHQILGSFALASSLLLTLRLLPLTVRRALGHPHHHLQHFSMYYCRWCGIEFDNQIAPLPVGLVLKWSDGTRLEEVAATIMMRSAGFPTPKIILYGVHPSMPQAPMSILMTRIPGKDLGTQGYYVGMTDSQKKSIFAELQCMIQVMRKWTRHQGEQKICSVLGTAVRSVRIPNHAVRPCESENEFNDHLFESLVGHNLGSQEKFVEMVAIAERLLEMRHPIVFTHGDLKHHNIMVLDGHVFAFLDWESAGWYPDYWEFTTPLRYGRKDYWWNELVWKLGGEQCATELESEKALVPLTVDCWAW